MMSDTHCGTQSVRELGPVGGGGSPNAIYAGSELVGPPPMTLKEQSGRPDDPDCSDRLAGGDGASACQPGGDEPALRGRAWRAHPEIVDCYVAASERHR